MPSTHESFLVLRAQGGSRPALEELLRSVQAPLYGYLRGVVGDAALAEDVLQDVMVQVSRKLGWLRDPRLFRAWAFRIATRRAFRVLKAERAWQDRTVPEAE